MSWNLYKSKHLLWRPSPAFGKMSRLFERLSSPCCLVPAWASLSDHLHAQVHLPPWAGSYCLWSGSALYVEVWHPLRVSRDLSKEMFSIPFIPFLVRQDWIVFANQPCFANFHVYMGIYDSLSLRRNGIGVCLNLLRVSDWFCSHRTSF